MPRYLVERTYPERFSIALNAAGVAHCQTIIANDAVDQVTWLHSYVTTDKRKTICICDAPTPEAVRRAAQRSGLPIDRITEVRVFDPYFYL
jgi:hypothetical protein